MVVIVAAGTNNGATRKPSSYVRILLSRFSIYVAPLQNILLECMAQHIYQH